MNTSDDAHPVGRRLVTSVPVGDNCLPRPAHIDEVLARRL